MRFQPFSFFMSHLQRLLLALAIIFISLIWGYFTKLWIEKRNLNQAKVDNIRKKMQSLAIFGLLPFSAMLSLWGLPQPHPGLLFLPLLGLLSYIVGGSLALLFAKLVNLSRPQTGSFYCCGSFTNLGAVGGLVCLLFLGENTIALVALYRLLEEIFYFGIAFPVARQYGPQAAEMRFSFAVFLHNPLLPVIILALAAGILLNIYHVPRPPVLGSVASFAMLAATFIFLFAIGLTLHISRIGKNLRPALIMCVIKFVGSPLVIVPFAFLLGLGALENGIVIKTVAILACMPVAMTALVPPSLFDLDLDLANTCWIITTAGLVMVLPALMFLLPQI